MRKLYLYKHLFYTYHVWTAWAESVSCPRFNKFILLYLRGRPYPAACHLLPKITQAVLGEAFQMPNACWDEFHLAANCRLTKCFGRGSFTGTFRSGDVRARSPCLLSLSRIKLRAFHGLGASQKRNLEVTQIRKRSTRLCDSSWMSYMWMTAWRFSDHKFPLQSLSLNSLQQPNWSSISTRFNPQPWHYLRSQRHLYNHKSWKHVRLPGHGSMELKQPEVTKVTEVTQSPAWWLPMMYHCSGTNQNPSMVRGQVRIFLHIYVKVCPWDHGLFWGVFTYDPGAKDSALRLNQTAHMCLYGDCRAGDPAMATQFTWNSVGSSVAIGAGTLSQLVESIIFFGHLERIFFGLAGPKVGW